MANPLTPKIKQMTEESLMGRTERKERRVSQVFTTTHSIPEGYTPQTNRNLVFGSDKRGYLFFFDELLSLRSG
jgi:hypothetical protein